MKTKNGFTPEQEELMIKETKAALRNSKNYSTAKEMMSDILGKKW